MARAARRDIEITKGDVYTHVVTFSESQNAYTFTATLGTGATFANSYDDTTYKLTLSLTTVQTTALTADTTWKLRRSDSITLLAGRAELIQ